MAATITQLDASQLAVVDKAVSRRLSVVNGGAGVGKTTIVKVICQRLLESGQPFALCAFAGKAAARLREATGRSASTIHSMLGWKGDGMGFTLDTLEGRAVILDEASMVPSDLLAEIVKRNPARLVLVGDEAQLPPVGIGQPFHDIVRLLPDAVSTLTTCYRNKAAIHTAAAAVREGLSPFTSSDSGGERYSFQSVGDELKAHKTIYEMVQKGELDFSQDIVLCCRNGDGADIPCSVGSLNAAIKGLVNPPAENDKRPPLRRIDKGDRVIRIKNDSATDTWNGTTGTVFDIDVDGAMWVRTDYPILGRDGGLTNEVLIQKDKVKDWQLGYALTVHKAQGSQYRKVVFAALLRDTHSLLDRPMLYTAITRAMRECVVVGEKAAMARAVQPRPPRRTILQHLLTKGNAQ